MRLLMLSGGMMTVGDAKVRNSGTRPGADDHESTFFG
jgi:hypothetical protein